MAAEDALIFLVQSVQKQAVDHYHLVSGAENELQLLEGEGNSMSAFLKDLGKQPMKGEVLKQCEREVRDVAYDALDILDEGLTRAALHNSTKLGRFLNPKYTSLAYKVKSFRRETIKPLFDKYEIRRIRITSSPLLISHAITTNSDHHHNLQITPPIEEIIVCPKGEASTSGKFLDPQFEHACPRRGSVVGFKEEADTIIKLLCEESKQLDAISIIGGPGGGKTELAWKIFKDRRIKDEFPMLIWADVSQSYEKRKVYRSILESLTQEDTSSLGDDKLASTIKVYLQNQKFLLCLDGVAGNAWEDIEAALPKANHLGKVLITSRHNKVAVKANCTREPYKLGALDPEKSWELLQLQVFDNLNICPLDLDPLGRIIARGCGGVPLAIVVIGGFLSQAYSRSTGMDETRMQWEKVSNNVSKYLNDEGGLTRNAIALSFNQLSLDLRNCFLYLGNFPEDSQIPVWRLIRLWIAEGFVWRKLDMSLEEVGYHILMDLIDRNLVMVGEMKPDGYIKTCRIHGLIREFCKNESSPENHNLFQEMEMSSTQGIFSPPLSQIHNRRRISIHSHVEPFLRKKPKAPRAHSFLCFAEDAVASLPDGTSLIPMHFTRLRVLHMNLIRLTKFPSKVSQLIHLRYISVSGDGDDFRVPKAISKLWNLETLIVETNLPAIEMKANIWKMEHLRHLKSKAAIVLDSKSKGTAGEHLQSVSRVSAKCFTEGALNRAKNLKSLGIRGDLALISEADYFREFQCLEKVKLVYDVSPKLASEKPLPRLPSPDRFPPRLRILQISGTFLTWHQIRVLENLPCLQVLILKNNAFDGKYWPALHGCFRTLETLIIIGTGLVVWTSKQGYFSNLKCLVLKDCKELQKIPVELTENLERLHVECVSESAVESAKKIAEAKRKVQGKGRGGFKLEIIDSGGRS